MNNFTKKIVSGVVLITMATYTMPIFAFANEETIYSKLMSDGEKYKTIISTTIENEGEKENIQVESNKELPVDCKVTYELDGKEVSADEIAGKSGKVKIKLQYINKSKNLLKVNGKNENIYTPFVVIAGAIINNDNNENVEITNGKVINDGSKTIVVGFAMPGMQESLDLNKDDVDIPDNIEITMDSKNFEIGNIMNYYTPKLLEKEIDFSNFDELFDKVDELQNAINEIESGTLELKDGVITLKDGAQTLNNGANELNNGMGALKTGSTKLNDGAKTLKAGTTEYTANAKVFNSKMSEISSGAEDLDNGYNIVDAGIQGISDNSNKLATGANSLKDGINQVVEGVGNLQENLGTLKAGSGNVVSGLEQVSNGAKSALDLANSLNATTTVSVDYTVAKDAINTAITANNSSISAITNANTELANQIANLAEFPEAQSALQNIIDSNNGKLAELSNSNSILNNALSSINGNQMTVTTNNAEQIVALQRTLAVVCGGIDTAQNGAASIDGGIDGIIGGVNKIASNKDVLTNGAAQVAGGLESLASGANELKGGSNTVKNGIGTLKNGSAALLDANNQLTQAAGVISNGANTLANGIAELDSNVVKLVDGSNELKNGTSTLNDGSATLLDGVTTLSDGVSKFNNDGIKKLSNEVNGKVKNTIKRAEKLENLANEYNKFGSDEKRDGIKFISMINSIKNSAKENKEEEVILNSDTNVQVKEDKKESK